MQQSDNQLFINIIELKCKNPSIDILKQLNKYIQWVIEYICPLYTNITIKITPIIIAPYNINNIIDSQDIFTYNKQDNIIINNLKQINLYIENNIIFEELT